MSHPPPSAPPLPGSQAPQQAYPPPTYTHPPPGAYEQPPPYYPSPAHADPLPSKAPLPGQPPYQQPGVYPPSQPPPPQAGYQPYQYPVGSAPPPQPGYYSQPPPPQPGYPTTPYSSGYQAMPPQPGYQPPTSQPNYPPPPPQAQGYGLTNQMANMTLQQAPLKAGDSPLLASFTHGNVVILTSCASGKTLRINNSNIVEGRGGRGVFAQFRVHVRRPGVVALQNIQNSENWLAIYERRTIGTGTGDQYCEFLLNEVEPRYVCLESAMAPGQYVGVLPDGSIKPPENTRTGPHGRFTVSVHVTSQPNTGPMSVFTKGNIVILLSCASGKSLRINKGTVESRGGHGVLAQFRVHVRRPGVVALQNVNDSQNWLAIRNSQTLGTGRGGPFCDFEVKVVDGQYVCLESVKYPGQHVGVLPDGSVKPPHQTGKGPHGRFIASALSAVSASPGHLSLLSQGNVVILGSHASGKSLRINEANIVEGRGGRGEFAQFRVHVRRPGVVALQNVRNPNNWLAIFQGQTIGTGKGGPYCEFEVKVVGGQFVCLESVMHPGQHVGVLPNGSAKPPHQTGKGQHGQFTVSVLSYGPAAAPPPPAAAPPPQAAPGIQSMFAQGNVVVLESCASGKSLRINEGGDVQGTGGRGQFAQFRVHVRRPGVVALQNVHDPNNWLAIFQGQTVGTGKGGQFCEFKLVTIEGRYVCLESVKQPGQHVGILPDGCVKAPGSTGTGQHGRFIPTLHI